MSLTHDLSSVAAPKLTIDGETVSSARSDRGHQPGYRAGLRRGARRRGRRARPRGRRCAAGRRGVAGGYRWSSGRTMCGSIVAVIRAHIDELALLVTLEQGKPLGRATGEINSGLGLLRAVRVDGAAGRGGPR